LAHLPVAVLVLVRGMRTEVQRLCADLLRSDAVQLTEFIAFPRPLWHICQLLFWFLSV
jgi:hypothetical protein